MPGQDIVAGAMFADRNVRDAAGTQQFVWSRVWGGCILGADLKAAGIKRGKLVLAFEQGMGHGLTCGLGSWVESPQNVR